MTGTKKTRRRYPEEKIVKILKEVEIGRSVAEVCREHGISDQTYRNWKKRYSGMDVTDVREYRRLVAENAKLKKIVADQALDIMAIKELLSKKW
jgi:putative transposase